MYVLAQVCLSDSPKPEYGLPRRSSYSNTPLLQSYMENPAHPGSPLPELLKHECFANTAVRGPSPALVCVLGFAARGAGATEGDCTHSNPGLPRVPRHGCAWEGQGGEVQLLKPMQRLPAAPAWDGNCDPVGLHCRWPQGSQGQVTFQALVPADGSEGEEAEVCWVLALD